MTYEQAFKIGSQCDGYIRCTYANIQNTEEGFVFSVQRAFMGRNEASYTLNESMGAADGAAQLTYDLPIVVSDGKGKLSPDGKWVQVKLTREALEMIAGKMAGWINRIQDGWNIYRVYDVLVHSKRKRYYKGKKVLVETVSFNPNDIYQHYIRTEAGQQTSGKTYIDTLPQSDKWHYEVEENWRVSTREERASYHNTRMAEMMERWKDQLFYVRISAIDWIPTNIENAVVSVGGQEIQLSDALADAKKKLEQAKALLATTATAAIVL